MESIRLVDLEKTSEASFVCRGAVALVVTQDNKLMLQQRPPNWRTWGGLLTTFGGNIETGETPIQGLVRELKEELGAHVLPEDVVDLGTITEAVTNYTELVYAYFWQDKRGTITGCYECEAVYCKDVPTVLAQSNLMDYARWMFAECIKKGLLTA